MKTVLFTLILCFACSFSLPARRARHTVDDSPLPLGQHLKKVDDLMKVQGSLVETSRFLPKLPHRGLLSVKFGNDLKPHLVCYPVGMPASRQVYFLSHALCRQLGYMSLQKILVREVQQAGNRTLLEHLSPSSWNCEGHEQSVSQCRWNTIQKRNCTLVTEVICRKCEETFTAREGYMKSPGYPIAHLYDLTCEWNIATYKYHFLRLAFTPTTQLQQDQSIFHCSVDKPYVEIISYEQDYSSITTICDFKQMKNMTIATNKVRIRYFSGLFNPKYVMFRTDNSTSRGIAISYQAVPASSATSIWWILLLLFLVAGFLSVICASLYFIKRLTEKCLKDQAVNPLNVPPGRQQLDNAYTFQRCTIQEQHHGLRLRSNNSKPSIPSVILTTASDNLSSVSNASRKLSSRNTPRSIPSLYKLKTRLADRFSKSGSFTNSSTSVYLPMEDARSTWDFEIYRSQSCANNCDSPDDVVFAKETGKIN